MLFGIAYTVTTTLQQACLQIKTGYGVSDPVYGVVIVPITDIGQGNGLGPSLWALISTVIINM